MKVKSTNHRYSMESIISIGTFGNTYLGFDDDNPNKQFQITVENKDRIQDQESLSQIMIEHNIIMSLKHPNILNCLEIFEDDSHFYIVFDYFSDTTLEHRYLGLQRISEDKLQFIFQQLVELIMYFHKNGFAIGSIRSESFLINDKYEIVLSNLSCVQSLTLPIPKKNFVIPPPEILNGQCQSTASCEVFTLGVLLYMIASRGSKPWDTLYDNELKMMYQNSMPMQPPSMSPLCFALVKEMLELDPTARYSMAQVQQHPWVQKNKGRIKFQISHVRIPTPTSPEKKRRASAMKNLILSEKRKKGSENNPALSNISVPGSPTLYKHRKSVNPNAIKLPRLELF